MKILAIGAHPDDIEIFMYGLISVLKKLGNELFFIVATDGSQGGKETGNKLAKLRAKETNAALNRIGKLHLLGLPDGQLGDDNSHKEKLRKVINIIKPDLVITHYKKDYHSDHRILSNFVTSIIGHYVPILFCDTMMGLNFIPNYYVDITNYFELKKQAILKHKSQNPERFIELAILMNTYRAAQCNAPKGSYSEAYYFKHSFPFADIRHIIPKSFNLRPFHIKNVNGFL